MKSASFIALTAVIVLSGCLPANYKTLPAAHQSYVEVFSVEKSGKAELHSKLQQWIATTVGDSKATNRLDDSGNGVLISKIIAPNGIRDTLGVGHDLYLTIKFESKDGRYRYTASDFLFYYQGPGRPVSIGSEYDSAIATAKELGQSAYSFVMQSSSAEDF